MYTEKIARISGIEDVEGVVFVDKDGLILASDVNGEPEEKGALPVFVGEAAIQVGSILKLGSFETGAVNGEERFLIFERPEAFLGVFISRNASVAMVESEVEETVATIQDSEKRQGRGEDR